MTTSSTSNSALTSILSGLTNNSAAGTSTSTSGPLITTGQINVSQLVSELMLIQSQPLTQLQRQEAGVKSTLSAYGQEQSALSSLQSAAAALALPSAFQASSATVTGSGVSATVTGNPPDANYSVAVTNLAQAQTIASAPITATSAPIGTGTLTIQAAGSSTPIPVTIDSTNNTLSGIAAAINSAAGGTVNASVVTDSSGSRLVLSSANTGASNAFTVTNLDGGLPQFAYSGPGGASGMTQTQAAADASFSVNGLALTSASNSVSTVISGVTLNLTQASSSSQVQIATDPTAVTNSVNGFISAYNSLITLTNSLTKYDANTNTASVLTGDSATRNIVGSLQAIVGGQWDPTASHPYSWLAQVGVSVNADGTLALNATQFQAALSANPSGVADLFTGAGGSPGSVGLANQVSNAAQQMIGANGALGSAEQNLQSQVTYMNNQQTLMQAQLAQTQASLTQEYSALNAEISAAQAQQASLTNQLAALPG